MNFTEFEKAVSARRLTRYLHASGGNQSKAHNLYRLNLKLSGEFYLLSNIFEVTIRNAVDRHFAAQFSDPDWLINQCGSIGMFSYPTLARNGYRSRNLIQNAFKELGIRYDHDALLASLNFGTWCYLFAPMQFRAGGQSLLNIFPARPRGTNNTLVFNDLERIRFFRNRIAHHEAIIFDSTGINLLHAKDLHKNMFEKTEWLGFQPQKLFAGLGNVEKVLKQIELF